MKSAAGFILERVSEPDIEPMTVAEMKRNLRMFASSTTRDDDVTRYVASARQWVERYTNRALIDQSWRLTIGPQARLWPELSGPPVIQPTSGYSLGTLFWRNDRQIFLRRSPILAIVSVNSVDTDGTETLVAADTYQLREADSKAPVLATLDGTSLSSGMYRIVFRAGYANRLGSPPPQDADDVPGEFKQAMILWAQGMYDSDPDSMGKYLDTAERLVERERIDLGFA